MCEGSGVYSGITYILLIAGDVLQSDVINADVFNGGELAYVRTYAA